MLTAAQARPSRQERSEQLVAICPEVLSGAEHALGNLFQRIQHIARVSRDGLGANAERLHSALTDLQELLDLVFDYVTPQSLEARPLGYDRVAESLVANVRPLVTREVDVEPAPALTLMVDARTLSRALQLLTKARARELGAAYDVAVTTAHDAAGGTVDLSLSMRTEGALNVPSDVDLTWEVAARLIELQGGELRQTVRDNALTITLSFPVNG